jgi:transmembrane sensor
MALLGTPTMQSHGGMPLLLSFCAPRDDHKHIDLPDGSRVELNAGSCLNVLYSDARRLIVLETGEAIFEVAHEPDHPFIVQSGPTSIVDVGTRFDVYRRKASTRVFVMQGLVNLYRNSAGIPSPSRPLPLGVGQKIDVPDGSAEVSHLATVTQQEMARLTAWLRGDIELGGERLSEVFTEFSRYQDVEFNTDDPRILNIEGYGAYRTTDVDGFLSNLRGFCIRATSTHTPSGKRIIALTRSRRCSP